MVADPIAEIRGECIAGAQAAAGGFIRVGGADAAPGGTDITLAPGFFQGLVECQVGGCDQVGGMGKAQPLR
jgi:hypothetical protein